MIVKKKSEICTGKVRKFSSNGRLSARVAAGNVGSSKVLALLMEQSRMESYYSSKGKPGCCVSAVEWKKGGWGMSQSTR